jgi:hypothetical protein
VEVAFQRGWKETTVSFNGEALDTIATRLELEAGREFALPDGSRLTIHLPKRFMPLPRVALDGRPMHMYVQAPKQRLRAAFHTALLIALVNLAFGVLAGLREAGMVRNLGGSYLNLGYGAVFLVLAFFVKRRSLLALAAALTLFGLDTVAWLYVLHGQEQKIPPILVVLRAGLAIIMIRGFSAIRLLRREQESMGTSTHRTRTNPQTAEAPVDAAADWRSSVETVDTSA